MPTYTYKREDGTTFDIEQRISDDRFTTCPTTGQPVERLISGGGGLVFKGSGFYQTDYVRSGDKSAGKESSDSVSAENRNENKNPVESKKPLETAAPSSKPSEK